jgi:hypothetical protein
VPRTTAAVAKGGYKLGNRFDRTFKLGEIATDDIELVSIA